MLFATLWFFSTPADPCPPATTAIVIRTADHRLSLCEQGRAVETFAVALGSGGTGKRRQGDEKTPLGEYSLAAPRPSASFGTFILLGYPTAAQRAQGYTGSAVGIHGPLRHLKYAGKLNVMTDWTLGCIAVQDDPSIERIAAWVRAHPKATVHLE